MGGVTQSSQQMELLGPAFDGIALKLIAAAGPCSLGQTLILRRQTLEDSQILETLSANQLRVVFNVLMTRKIQQFDAKICDRAIADGFDQLLPPISGSYSDGMREADKETLANSFVQARIASLCEGISCKDGQDQGEDAFNIQLKPLLSGLDLEAIGTHSDRESFDQLIGDSSKQALSLPISGILKSRHEALADQDLSQTIHPNQLRVLFNIWMTQKIRAMDAAAFDQARAEKFQSLLPDMEDTSLQDQDRQTLNYAFAQARITNMSGEEIAKHAVKIPEAYQQEAKPAPKAEAKKEAPAKDSKASENKSFEEIFLAQFPDVFMDQMRTRLSLIQSGDNAPVFLLNTGFTDFLLGSLYPKYMATYMKSDMADLAKNYEAAAKEAKTNRARLADPDSANRAIERFLKDSGQELFTAFLAKSAGLIRDFPDRLEKARNQLALAREAEENRSKLSKLFGGEDKDQKKKVKQAQKFIDLQSAFEKTAECLPDGKLTKIEQRDFDLLAELVENVLPDRVEETYEAVRSQIYMKSGPRSPGADLTDSLCKFFRDEETSMLEIGIIFSLLVYRNFPFNLEHFDAFFKNNARFSMDKVVGSYPYLKNALAWELSTQAGQMAQFADKDDESGFDDESRRYKISRRVALVLEMRGVADQIANDLCNREVDLADEGRQRYWQETKLAEFRPT